MSEFHISGGTFTGCQFGDSNSMENYNNAVDGTKLPVDDEDGVKAKLKEIRQGVDDAEMDDLDKAEMVEYLLKISEQLSIKQEDRHKRGLSRWFQVVVDLGRDAISGISGLLTDIAAKCMVEWYDKHGG